MIRSGGYSRWGRFLVLGVSASLGALAFAAVASADLVVCQPGSGLGQCNSPSGVAVDREDEILYVADNGNKEIDAYDAADSSFLASTAVGVSLGGIAVDNDSASPSPAHHDVYAFDTTNNRVLKLSPLGGGALEFEQACGEGSFASQAKLAIGPGGVIHVADNTDGDNRRVQTFDHECVPLETCSPLPPGGFGGNLMGFAVDSTGAFFIASAGGRPIRKYNPACVEIESFHTSFNIQALATDATSNLYVVDGTDSGIGGATSIYAYSPAAVMFHVFYGNGTLLNRANALAPFTTPNGDIFASEGLEQKRAVQIAIEPPGPVVYPNPEQSVAKPIGNTSATLNSRVNPEGKATTYHFEYVDHTSYTTESGFASPNKKVTAETALPIPTTPTFAPELFRLAQASADIGCPDPEVPPQASCLEPETKYHFRVIAKNADGEDTGPESVFETGPPFEIIAYWASEVGSEDAKLHAQVNPLNIPTTGHFEYVDEATFEEASGFSEAIATAPMDFGSSEAAQTRAVQLQGLEPGTAYRYRLVIMSAFGKEEEREGAFRTFALPEPTPSCPNDEFRGGPAADLPDCRAYEMVSPVDKEGGEIVGAGSPEASVGEALIKSAATVPGDGRGLTYSSYRAFGEPLSAPLVSQYLASRHPIVHIEEGWSSEAISPPREGAFFQLFAALNPQYKAFSEDLTYGWLGTESEPPLTADAIAGQLNLYRRESETGSYEALCPVEPPNLGPGELTITLAAVSDDGSVAAFQANNALTPNAPVTSTRQVYACKEGQPEPVLLSVLPGGEENPDRSSVGVHDGSAHHGDSTHNAVSVDGSRIYWTDLDGGVFGEGKIYLRENAFGEGAECAGAGTPCTVAVSEAVGGAGSSDEAIFWTASPDGARAIFSFDEGPLKGNLYAFDATDEAEPTQPIAEGVSGLAGWSEDASLLYLVSTKALAPGAEAGESNLYLYDASADSFALVAVLPGGPGVSNFFCEIDTHKTASRCTRTTPEGLQLAFMSSDPLTGYDNTDLGSPAPCGASGGRCDSEVFLYDAAANAGAGELRCVSCNPSGARPRGKNVGGESQPAWIAARLPRRHDSFHAPRALSADGKRLFFESFDPLVLRDTNGALDVYQWEQAGKGDCDDDEEDPHYSPANGGCISLISSGQDRDPSRFMDASADGSDVFIRTNESLLPQDPGVIDIYDARILGGLPVPPPPIPPCEGEACQSPPPPPEDPTPASAVQRPGNPTSEPKPRKRACPKGKRRAGKGKKARCVKKQRKRKRGSRR